MLLSPTHRRLTVLAVIVLVAPVLMALLPPASARGQGGEVVISQLYVGGGSGDAPLNADFVELFNRGGDPVALDGWSVQYASAEGTTWNPVALTGTLDPGAFYPGLRPGVRDRRRAAHPRCHGSARDVGRRWPRRPGQSDDRPRLWQGSQLRHRTRASSTSSATGPRPSAGRARPPRALRASDLALLRTRCRLHRQHR